MLGVVDAVQSIKPDVQTVALGACYSYSSLLLVRRGRRGWRGEPLVQGPSKGGGSLTHCAACTVRTDSGLQWTQNARRFLERKAGERT